MKLIITRTHVDETFCLYDTDTENLKSIPFENGQENTNCDNTRPAHRPFGVTWDADNIYIASRKSLLVYDSDLKWVDKIELLDENTHQIAMAGNKIAVCMTRKDCIGLLDPVNREMSLYHPNKGWGEHPTLDYPNTHVSMEDWPKANEERYHINSVLPIGNRIFFLMQKPCTLAELDLETDDIKYQKLRPYGLTHGILYKSDSLIKTQKTNGTTIRFSDASRDKALVDSENMPWWRGIAGTYEEPIYSYSRKLRVSEDSPIGTAGFSNGKIIEGPISDIRRIDGQDDAHHNPHPFPYAWE